MEVIDLCDLSDEATLPISSKRKSAGDKNNNGNGLRPKNDQDGDGGSVVSISSNSSSSSTEEFEFKIDKSSISSDDDVGKADNDSNNAQGLNLPQRQRRRRRTADGYRLEEGEQIVWATEIETGKAHQAIIRHPQPDPPSGKEDVVCVQWLNFFYKEDVWIPRSNIGSLICGGNGAAGKNKQSNQGVGIGNENARDKGNEIYGRTSWKRKRVRPNYLGETVAGKSKLALEQAKAKRNDKKKVAKKGRRTCCTNVEFASKPTKLPKKLPANVRAAIAQVRRLSSAQAASASNADSKFDGDWWQRDRVESKVPVANAAQSIEGQSVPASFVSFEDNQSVSSGLTSELPESDLNEHSGSHECETEDDNAKEASPQCECHVCESRVHHHNLIEKLLGDLQAVKNDEVDENDFIDSVARFKVILQGLEDQSCDDRSIFFYACNRGRAQNPILTVVKLLQLLDCVCQISDTVLNQSAVKDTNMALLFRPWKKAAPKDCGVILQLLRVVTFEFVNSRVEFVPPENSDDIDQLMGVTFGLQLMQTISRNYYSDYKTKLQTDQSTTFGFLNQPLESHRKCIRRNCQLGRKPMILCKFCGVRFHKSCLCSGSDENTDGKLDNCCPCCKDSSLLVRAARTGNLSDVYSLVVEKGASPLQSLTSESACNQTALHAALQSNNYDLASMLLLGSHLLLNCDDSLLGWNFPDIAWGRDDNQHNPFKSGISSIMMSMDRRPPVEILLLLCGRGAQGSPEDIRKALQTRQGMMQLMKGLQSQTLLKSDISMGMEPSSIPLISNTDYIPSFMYVAKNVESRSTAIRWFDCRFEKKQLTTFKGECTTDALKFLHQKQSIQPSWKAYCNYLCDCRANKTMWNGRKCECQLVEDGVRHGLEVFETSDGRGFGVRTAKGVTIKKDEILCHYVGEIITSNEAKKRDQEYAGSASYLLDIDEKRQFCIDATQFRSVAALINHSCSEQNCALFRALGNHLDANFPFLGIRAKEDISELTELTFNYGDKPEGHCSECNGHHCLCRQCSKHAHRK